MFGAQIKENNLQYKDDDESSEEAQKSSWRAA